MIMFVFSMSKKIQIGVLVWFFGLYDADIFRLISFRGTDVTQSMFMNQ